MIRNSTLIEKIKILKEKKDAIIVAHYYQSPEIQYLADFVGDSLALVRNVYNSKNTNVVFCGVRFMAETTKVINNEKNIMVPDFNAGCSLVDTCQLENFLEYKNQYPDHKVVTYINSSLKIKAISDYIVTSANAVNVINNISKKQKLIFTPDKNLGKYLNIKTNRNMLLWNGECEVHVKFSENKLKELLEFYPDAKILAHPESEFKILKYAHFIGSTSAIIKYVYEANNDETFIIATEAGIEYSLIQNNPNKKIMMMPIIENNQCACSECPYMKMNTLEKIYDCLNLNINQIIISEELQHKTKNKILEMINWI